MAIQGYSLSIMRRLLHTAPVDFQAVNPPKYFHFLQTLKELNQGPKIPDHLEHEITMFINAEANLQWREMPLLIEFNNELKPYRRAISQITERTMAEYCANSPIFEMGSGVFPILELLPNLAESIQDRIILSDFNENRLQFLQKQ